MVINVDKEVVYAYRLIYLHYFRCNVLMFKVVTAARYSAPVQLDVFQPTRSLVEPNYYLALGSDCQVIKPAILGSTQDSSLKYFVGSIIANKSIYQ